MKPSVLIPVISHGFEMNYFSKSHDWLMKNNESSLHPSQIQDLFRLHRHDVTEILVFLEGEVEFFCEGQSYSLKRGDVVIIPPYAVHQAVVKNFDTYKRIIVSVSEHLMDDFMSSSPSMKEHVINQKTQGSYVLHLHAKIFQHITSSLQEMNQRLTNGENNHSFSINYLLFQVLQDIFDPASSIPNLSNKNEQDPRFIAILEYIESHLTESDLSLDNVSDYFHLNKYYFSHYFTKNMNLPFYRYVSLKRLSYAVTMIRQNQISIEHISLKCGFPDYSSFYRLFKKEYNLSPKKLQKEFKHLQPK
ncbi:AraC family transcriptional regulator [Paenibacillus pectinilyticus]|uniref:AraC family transcriptional regulator n=1 Tax=Paenibacillus pectinilyticus TaxID=512399 RepID=A0A1C1A2P9_9BACL|nr:AraC family transcriptional regulator [Paenibacillus pectinilyticus]OCT14796.1 AraC family transcriptional regulator [Paenibacillus pectinilyticus]